MCGIIGYIGDKEAYPILVNGLKRLEYRGYDSAGVAIISGKKLAINKVVGRVENLAKTDGKKMHGSIGIAHTRWATHGKPSIENAHPHLDCSGKIAIIHNGIIENYLELKNRLKKHKFSSETDSEVIAHLVEENYKSSKGNLKDAVSATIKELYGTYALCIIHSEKEEIVVARNGSPIVIGIGKGENLIASDVSAIVEYTKKIIYLDDFEMALVKKDSVRIFDKNGKEIKKEIRAIDWDLTMAEKQGYEHFMLKEICEQPDVIRNTLNVEIKGMKADAIRRIFVVACGTAYHAGLVGKYIIEKVAGIPVIVDAASEFRYRDPLIGKGDLFIAVSQSGETADTLAALRLAKQKGAKTLGIINVMNSTIAREADSVIYTRAGIEIGVASTKAYTSQMIIFYLLAEKLAKKEIRGLKELPILMQKIIEGNQIDKIAKKYFKVYNFIFMGRNINYPTALEGALKLKEISYIHAEGYAAGEMKHGPIALVTDQVPTVAIAVKDSVYSKMVSNMQEVKARNGKIIAIATEGDKEIGKYADDVIFIPKTDEILTPVLAVVPLQLLAYKIAEMRDCDIDKPRNLAKSVTVE
ncbi:glutamine--fructose-6-phosphate transaminase (isomerizing) [Candidatus Woesearchaeota archaeon CG10_big_fil_rev_8_21_14_0_10_44_13]|nr:MAG: glutamine--fructose-6-phosphate transaminase (isomerizing) [Candidatus Woesearchaeota archaeon CG10_big_fil_rev_8_21_14_0_10_44_13]